MNQTQLDLTVVQRQYEETNTFPQMSESEQKEYRNFLIGQLSDCIEGYESYTYHHGGLFQEAKDLYAYILQAEKVLNHFKEVYY